jgi:hypothetical protein
LRQPARDRVLASARAHHGRTSLERSAIGRPQLGAPFTQVLTTCDRPGPIGKATFAIDGKKLPAHASKERRGTHAELAHRADRLDEAAARAVALHQAQDEHASIDIDAQRQARTDELKREARKTREFIAPSPRRVNRKGAELKTNGTDPDSAKMATGKGVIRGHAAQAAMDGAHQVIVAADVIIASGSAQSMLIPRIDKTAPVRQANRLFTADCAACALPTPCLRNRKARRGRQVARFEPRPADAAHPSQRLRDAIDSPRGRAPYGALPPSSRCLPASGATSA